MATVPGERQERLSRFAELSVSRAIAQGYPAVTDGAALDLLVGDCAAIGLLEPVVA